jgi:alkanesulfonate monooxygenase SsuD/methylene tetrahydromethanopterin reductase-like flavin-dependent oxidoreductase (luciferase family)
MAEDCGWDGVFLEDYLVYQGDAAQPTYDPWICLAAMACATSTIRLGTTVTPVPRRHPWQLAAETVALDHLSNGRLILGVGIGDPGDPFLTGTPRELAEKLDESLEIITALWTGEPVQYAGKHYQLDGAQLTAVPAQQPRIPIWVGGNFLVPSVRRRILRWDGSCAYKGTTTAPQQVTPEDIRELLTARQSVRASDVGAGAAGAAAVGVDASGVGAGGVGAGGVGAGGVGGGFDVKVKISDGDSAAFADAGATWQGRWIAPGPVAEAREILRAGPPRLP